MTTISITNSFSRIKSTPKVLETLYKKFTKFQPSSTPHLPPKVIRLCTKAGRFPSGLLNEVIAELNTMNVEYTKMDTRENKGILPNISSERETVFRSGKKSIELYSYQKDSVDVALAEQRGIIKCATGGGKTMMMAAILKCLDPNVKKLIMTRSLSLVSQTRDVLQANDIPDIGCVTGSICETEANVIICTIQSIHKLKDVIRQIKVLIIDEVHLFTSRNSIAAFRMFDSAVMRLGFSATPWKRDDDVHNYILKGWIGPELCDIKTQYLTQEQTISRCVCFFHPFYVTGVDKLPFNKAEEIGIASNREFHERVVDLVRQIPEGRVLILVSKLAHGTMLHSMIPESHWIKGEDSLEEREFVFGLLIKSPNIKEVVISSSIIYTGINVAVHYLINATG